MMGRAFDRARRVVVIGLVVLGATAVHADTIFVDDDAPSGGDGTSWETAYRFLQDALTAAEAGDEIRVATGVYTPDVDEGGLYSPGDQTATFQLISGVALYGGFAGLGGPDADLRDVEGTASILSGDIVSDDGPMLARAFAARFSGDGQRVDPGGDVFDYDRDGDVDAWDYLTFRAENNRTDNSFHVVTAEGADESAVLDGFTIADGDAAPFVSDNHGAGIRGGPNASPTLRRCTVTRNTAFDGDGVGVYDCDGPIENCVITDNSSIGIFGAGGGLYGCDGPIVDCEIAGNWGGHRGGGLARCGGEISRCLIFNNRLDSEGAGAGLWDCDGTIDACTVIANRSGGGLAECDGCVRNCLVSGNSASWVAGGVSSSNGSITHCTITDNRSTTGSGGVQGCLGTIDNCVIWGNATDVFGVDPQIADSSMPSHSCIQDWEGGGVGNTSEDPRFRHGASGRWTADPVYDAAADVTILRDDRAGWTEDEWRGFVMQPVAGWVVSFAIVANDGNTVTVAGDASGAASGAAYQIQDFDLAGTSPCIDAGANDPFWCSEPGPEGGGRAGEPAPRDLKDRPRFSDAPMTPDTGDPGESGPPIVDMGAYEFQDCNANAVPDDGELVRRDVLLSADFEAGTFEGWSTTGLWHVTDQCPVDVPVDPAHWAYFGLDETCNFETGEAVWGELAAPAVLIPATADRVELIYGSVYDGDRGSASGPSGFDLAWVDAGGSVLDDVGPTAALGDWETRRVDLTAYIGQTVSLSWRFDSVDAVSNERLGWQVDWIEVVTRTDNDCDGNGVPDECDTDCNSNGIPDACDIEAGTSPDCQPDGIPDECQVEQNDCNTNGLPDECDVTDGTSADCNSNGVPDECDVEAGTSPDCQADGIPDECQLGQDDCNSNGAPDGCDIEAGTSPDCQPDGVPDECQVDQNDCNSNGIPDVCDLAASAADCNTNGILDECDFASGASLDHNGDDIPDECQVENLTQGTVFATIGEALSSAEDDDALLAAAPRFLEDSLIDFDGTAATLRSRARVAQPNGGLIIMTDGSVLAAAAGRDIDLSGVLRVDLGDHATIEADRLALREGGEIVIRGAAVTDVAAAGGVDMGGTLRIDALAVLGINGPLRSMGTTIMQANALASVQALSNGGLWSVFGGIISSTEPLVNLADGGSLYGYGEFFADIVNHGDVTIITDTRVVGDYHNRGVTLIQHGSLTVVGTLQNDGVLIGDGMRDTPDPTLPRGEGGGVVALGDYVAAAESTLRMPSADLTFKVGGDFDVAVDAPSRFDLTQTTVQCAGLPEGAPQAVEVLALDVGRRVTLPEPLLYSIGRWRIGPIPTMVTLVDAHDNAPEDDRGEVLYVAELVLDPGVTLDLAGHVVYYGTVTPEDPYDPDSGVTLLDSVGGGALVPIGSPSQSGDIDGDGDIDLDDHALFPECMAGPDALPTPATWPSLEDCLRAFDFDADVDVDAKDFGGFQRAFTGPL